MEFATLTMKDRDKISNLNQKHHYALSRNMFKTLITKHKNAREIKDQHTMDLIEYRLTQINFHYGCGLLCTGKYDEAYEFLKNW
jgi:hypothetical protein